MTVVDNSFFHQDLGGVKAVIIVPHEDDEINTAGALICSLVKNGADTTIVYATNGDWKYSAEIRMNEAVNSASVLGVPEDHIYFLGYGDSVADDKMGHIFYHNDPESPAISAAGHKETYGTGKHQDYSYIRNGTHHSYTADNYLSDIVSVIEYVRPDLIVCSDFDEHPDHKMLSICLDKAIALIRKRNTGYTPEVWKGFAYACAYTSTPDFQSFNNPETKRPDTAVTEKYHYDLIDRFNYIWENRIRIPVPREADTSLIRKNIIAKALNQHQSQLIITRADRIINSDQVFWGRRTDSIAYQANVTVSSGNVSGLTDYQIYNVRNVDTDIPDFSNCYWQPDENDPHKTICFEWKVPVSVEQVVIYGTVLKDSSIDELVIKLSDGYEKTVKHLPVNGNPVSVNVGKHMDISQCEISISACTGSTYGISECEIFSSAEYEHVIKPFCKILINSNFAYEYLIDSDTDALSVTVYRFGKIDGLDLAVIKGSSVLSENKLIINDNDSEIILRAANQDNSVFDQIIIRKIDNLYADFRKNEIMNKKYLKQKRLQMKLQNMTYILRHSGIKAVFSRTINNVIKPRIMRK